MAQSAADIERMLVQYKLMPPGKPKEKAKEKIKTAIAELRKHAPNTADRLQRQL